MPGEAGVKPFEGSARPPWRTTVGGMFKKLLFLALIVGVGFLAAKKLRAA